MKKINFAEKEIIKALDKEIIKFYYSNVIAGKQVYLKAYNLKQELGIIDENIFYNESINLNLFEKVKEKIGKEYEFERFGKPTYDFYHKHYYIEKVEWNKGKEKELKDEYLKILWSIVQIAQFLDFVVPIFKELGFEIIYKEEDSFYLETCFAYIENGKIVFYKDIKKLWKTYKKLLKEIKCNFEILEKFPNKLVKLKEIRLDLSDFAYKEETKEGC